MLPVHVPAAARWALGIVRGLAGPAVDGDEPHPRLDHPAGKKQVLPEWMAAVTVAHLVGLLVQVKCVPALGAGHRIVALLSKIYPVLSTWVPGEQVALDVTEQPPSLCQAFFIAKVINRRGCEVLHRG